MSSTLTTDLSRLSGELTGLVSRVSSGVVAVKSAAYRVVSGISLQNNLIAVSNHTLRREGKIAVYSADGTEAHAAILGRDAGLDLAILKVEGLELKPLPYFEAAALTSGMLTAVVGLTNDAGPSASLGILGAAGPARRTWRGGTLDQFLRLDVNLYPSQSGAAVVDVEGRLIGMATPALSRHAAIALPTATIDRMTQELLRDGRIRHGYLGVGLQPVAITGSLSDKLATDARAGLILLSVEADSPAEKAGLQIGDIILELDGKRTADVEDLILRGGQLSTLEVPITERERKDH